MNKRFPLVLVALLVGFSIGWVLRTPPKSKTQREIEGIQVHIPAGIPIDGKSFRPLEVYLVEENGEVIYDRKDAEDSPPAWVITIGSRRYYAIPRREKS